jgi:hypothetical protein
VQFLHREDWNLVLSIQLFIVESLVQWFLVTPLNGMIAVNGLQMKKNMAEKSFEKDIFYLHFIIIYKHYFTFTFTCLYHSLI